jgi:GlpG protein
MRVLGTLPDQAQAERLVDYLVAREMLSTAEAKGDQWAVWIKDEDHVADALEAFEKFKANPADPAFDGHKEQADAVRREREEKLERARENTRTAAWLWARPDLTRLPVTIGLIVACAIVSIGSEFGQPELDAQGNFVGYGAVTRWVAFYDPAIKAARPKDKDQPDEPNVYADILHGQVWRLVTPILLHFSVTHLLFNMFWLYRVGSVLEHRRGSWWLLAFVAGTGLVSNVAQIQFGGGGLIGGFSGVDYALLGFAAVQMLFYRDLGFELDQFTFWIMIAWLGGGFTGYLDGVVGGRMGNWAHLFGLISGAAVAYLPHALRKRR